MVVAAADGVADVEADDIVADDFVVDASDHSGAHEIGHHLNDLAVLPVVDGDYGDAALDDDVYGGHYADACYRFLRQHADDYTVRPHFCLRCSYQI